MKPTPKKKQVPSPHPQPQRVKDPARLPFIIPHDDGYIKVWAPDADVAKATVQRVLGFMPTECKQLDGTFSTTEYTGGCKWELHP